MLIFIWTIQLILIPLVSPLAVGVIKKIKARLQNRSGASIFQLYRDLWKLFHKDEIISRDASVLFRVAPYIIFTVTIVVATGIPTMASFLKNNWAGDMLMVVYTLAIGTFFLALAGMDTGSAFGGFGSSREMTVSTLAEVGFIFSLFTVAIINNATNLFSIAHSAAFGQGQHPISMLFAFSGFFIVLLAETARFPYDNPDTHLELTMIHEAMILEYSGKKLALLEWASANKLLIFFALGANLFFPIGIAQTVGVGPIIFGLGSFLIKVFVFCLIIALIESTIAKYRFFRLPDLLLISFILNIVAISIIQ